MINPMLLLTLIALIINYFVMELVTSDNYIVVGITYILAVGITVKYISEYENELR